MTVGMSPESGRPKTGSTAVAGASTRSALERRDSAFTVVPERPRAEVITYTIQEGDTITAIAERYGLEKDTIAWSNDRNVVFALRPGNELYILPVDGVYHRALVDETVQAIADNIEEKLEEKGIKPLRKEGYREARWILLDYGSCVVHVFVEDDRRFYNLEKLWGDAKACVYSQ